MAITLKYYLKHIYPCECNARRNPKFRETTTNEEYFEIKDLENNNKELEISIITKANEGEALFYNPRHVNTYIVDFEHYIDSFRKGSVAASGQKCDFILSAEDYSFIIVNELKKREKRYIKEEEAIDQLNASIEKLSKGDVPFLSQFKHKVALLSYRLTDSKNTSLAIQGMGRFGKTTTIVKNISLHAPLQAGFILEQRIYPEKFELPS